ncbi:hypothetical protein KSF78_0003806 [Schistosoma japonicum]|nr:hypothetical protein KSF78_0003806 [Schistosoma japonicum]
MLMIMMLCFMQYTMCEEVTEMMTSESLYNTTDDLYNSVDITTSYIEIDQLNKSISMKTDGGDDDDNDCVVNFVTLIKWSLTVISVYLNDLLLITVIVMLCLMKFTMCEETTETIASESLSNTTDISHETIDMTTSYNETDQSHNSSIVLDNDKDSDDQSFIMQLIMFALMLLKDLFSFQFDSNTSHNDTMHIDYHILNHHVDESDSDVVFCAYMICQEVTEMMTSESSNMTMDDSNESADITDESSNSTDTAGDNDNADGDDGSDDDVVYVKSLRKMLEVILNSLGDLLSNSTFVKTKVNKTMTK